jgi:hypothetical protein
MKTVLRLLTLMFALATTSTISMGMGYPQDMFAEHVSVKQTANHTQTKKVRKERMDSQKAASSQSAQGVSIKRTMPCKSKCLPKKNNSNRQAHTQSAPLAVVPACRKICIVAVKVFKLDGNDVEEQVLPLDEFLNEEHMSEATGIVG